MTQNAIQLTVVVFVLPELVLILPSCVLGSVSIVSVSRLMYLRLQNVRKKGKKGSTLTPEPAYLFAAQIRDTMVCNALYLPVVR